MKLRISVAVIFIVSLCSCSYAAINEATVERAWSRISKADGFKKVPVNYVNEDSPNAWVAFKSETDYTINVTRGLMKILNTEDEMAGVWGHEIGHVRLGHYQLNPQEENRTNRPDFGSCRHELSRKRLQQKSGNPI